MYSGKQNLTKDIIWWMVSIAVLVIIDTVFVGKSALNSSEFSQHSGTLLGTFETGCNDEFFLWSIRFIGFIGLALAAGIFGFGIRCFAWAWGLVASPFGSFLICLFLGIFLLTIGGAIYFPVCFIKHIVQYQDEKKAGLYG